MAVANPRQVAQAYAHCQRLVRRHYENFPVASLLLPRRLRRPIAAIYAFARTADDFADEGALDSETRLTKLAAYAAQLDAIAAQQAVTDPVFIALADAIHTHHLPITLFHDLLRAFRQDVTKRRYETLDEIWDYARHSANPVGRLLLHLLDAATPDHLARADAVCSALQLINFLQDIQQDLTENDRIYIPAQEMRRFGVDEIQLQQRQQNPAVRALINALIDAAEAKLLEGAALGRAIPGRFGFQLRLMINGGQRIIDRLRIQTDIYSRPRLNRRDWLWMLVHAI